MAFKILVLKIASFVFGIIAVLTGIAFIFGILDVVYCTTVRLISLESGRELSSLITTVLLIVVNGLSNVAFDFVNDKCYDLERPLLAAERAERRAERKRKINWKQDGF